MQKDLPAEDSDAVNIIIFSKKYEIFRKPKNTANALDKLQLNLCDSFKK